MQYFTAGQPNIVSADVQRLGDDGNLVPVTEGVVNLYLQVKSGDNALKWFKGADESWSATEQVAAVLEHQAAGRWAVEVPVEAWETGARYDAYARPSSGTYIQYSDEIVESSVTVSITVESTVTRAI